MSELFKGWLICSDIDGTLTDSHCEVSEKNADAVNYFQSGGGLFTVSTGRYWDYVKNYSHQFVPNAPVVSLCGCVITDAQTGSLICDYPFHSLLSDEIIRSIFDYSENFRKMALNLAGGGEDISREEIFGGVYAERLHTVSEKLYKITFMSISDISQSERDFLFSLFSDDFLLEQSWNSGIEIYRRDSGKGQAVKKVKELTGARHLLCIGDQENDISMLKEADIGVAVANASEKVKANADLVLESTNQNDAVAECIDKLEKYIRQAD